MINEWVEKKTKKQTKKKTHEEKCTAFSYNEKKSFRIKWNKENNINHSICSH